MTRPTLAVMAGWFDGKIGADIHAQLSEFNPHKISSPLTNGGWPNWRWVERYIDKQAPDGPYVALGFSWGATAAARLAERDGRCVGLIYISGLEWRLESTWHGGWAEFPALCLYTAGEKPALAEGTRLTFLNLAYAGADVDAHEAPDPGTHRKPHLAGVAHHLPEIRAWVDKHFGKETQHGRCLQRERRFVP